MTQYTQSKKRVSTIALIIIQLLIYYPIAVYVGVLCHPGYIYEILEIIGDKVLPIHIQGVIIYLGLIVVVSNAFSIFIVFRILFRPSRFTYAGKNGWYSVWWSFGIQIMLFLSSWFFLAFIASDGFTTGSFDFVKFISYLCIDFSTFFIGIIGFYWLLSKISNKGENKNK